MILEKQKEAMIVSDGDEMKREYVTRFGSDQIVAQNAASVTTKLQQMASGFVYNRDAGPGSIWLGDSLRRLILTRHIQILTCIGEM